jgi:hypothetical protein
LGVLEPLAATVASSDEASASAAHPGAEAHNNTAAASATFDGFNFPLPVLEIARDAITVTTRGDNRRRLAVTVRSANNLITDR